MTSLKTEIFAQENEKIGVNVRVGFPASLIPANEACALWLTPIFG